jgi:hypothetical protein
MPFPFWRYWEPIMSTRTIVRTILNFQGFSLLSSLRSFSYTRLSDFRFYIDANNSSGYTLSGSTTSATTIARATSTTTTNTTKSARTPTSRDEELRQVRLKQQEIANERAQQAAILRKQKQDAEKERKNHVALNKKKQEGGDALGGESTSNKTTAAPIYNPLQPLAASSSGYR